MYKYYFNNSLEEIKSNLATRGYAIVTLTDDLVSLSNECYQEMNEFFHSDNKEQYFREPVFGWFEVPHKQVFRVATGNKMNNYEYPSSTLKSLIPSIDKMMWELGLLLFPGADKMTKIPFDFGLIDVVKYNNNTERKDNLNIVEHYDAGLIAFNFLDTAPGLQFKNEFGEWQDIFTPNNGIIWTGHAIKSYNESHPEGIHRVLTTDQPRFSMWYEIASHEQMRDDIKNNQYIGYDYEVELMKKEGYKPVKEDGKIVGYTNTFIGYDGWKGLESVTTGSNKVAIGYSSLNTGEFNTMIGYGWKVLESATTGSNKVAIGSLNVNTGKFNTVIGDVAIGSFNVSNKRDMNGKI